MKNKEWSNSEDELVVGMIKLVTQTTGVPGNLRHAFALSSEVINEVVHAGNPVRNPIGIEQRYYRVIRKTKEVFCKGNVKNYQRHS